MLRMGSVNLVVIVESVRSLATKPSNDLKVFHLPSILAVAVALGTFQLVFEVSSLTVQMQASKFFSFSTATRCVTSQVKSKFFGKTIAMIYSSTDLVGASITMLITAIYATLGILMATGGSKLVWCQ